MDMEQIDKTIVFSGKTYRLEFFADGFRLYEEGAKSLSEIVTLPSRAKAKREGNTFHFGSYELEFSRDLRVYCRKKDKVLLDFSPFEAQNKDLDLSLMEKEGHHVDEQQNKNNGWRFVSSSPVYGLGERSGPLDKRGYEYVNWNTDDPSAHVDTFRSLYQSIPFLILFRGNDSVGLFFDDTSKMRFDINKSEEDAVLVESPNPTDLYVFFGSMPKVIASYTALTGRNSFPPYWTLGAQQSRWSYNSAKEVDEVIEGYQKADIPLSIVYLDIDYMDHYKDFAINAETFPEIGAWLREKRAQGVRIVPIVDAGVKAEEGYPLYDEGVARDYFCTLNGEIYHNEVWPGDSVFPAFLKPKVRNWWAHYIKGFLDLGFAGIWNDMNEPASFKGPLPLDVEMGGAKHDLVHNVYGHFMARAGAEGFAMARKRPFQLTRAGFAGTCHYANTWAGDNQSIYDHLRLSFPQMMNMSLSGQSYIGVDIGGFSGDTTPELLTKWAAAALFFPLYRNHSALGTIRQEPYLLKGKYLEAYRNAVLLRYELIPAIYDELCFATQEGSIPLRPLIYNYPEDERVVNENTEAMLGQDLLIAPSFFPGESKRNCYFPDDFYAYPNGQYFEKGDHIIDCSIGASPIFLRKGGLVALSPKGYRGNEMPDVLRLLWGGGDVTIRHYEDEGEGLAYREGKCNLFRIHVSEKGEVRIVYLHHGLKTHYRSIILEKIDGESKQLPFMAKD